MEALVGIAARGDPARSLAQGCQAVAQASHVRELSRPWWAPARLGEAPGLLAVARIVFPRSPQRLRAWLWALERQHAPDVLFEPVAGLSPRGWRPAFDLLAEPAWIGPLSDVEPDFPLRTGRTAREHLAKASRPAASPWMDVGHAPGLEAPVPAATRRATAWDDYVRRRPLAVSRVAMAWP